MPQETCTQQSTVQPVISVNVEGINIQGRVRAVTISAGQDVTIQTVMSDLNGNPVDLSQCLYPSSPSGPAGSIQMRIAETVLAGSPADLSTTILGFAVNPPGVDGLVGAVLPSTVVAYPGISRAEFALLDSFGNVLFTNWLYVIINRSQWGTPTTQGPPSLAEIRLAMRDSDPSDNLWYGLEEYDMAEIAAAIEYPIMYFNESQPPLRRKFSTASFPFRYFWLQAIVSRLYSMASLHYTRVHLPYQQQAGLQVDDKEER